MAIFSAYQIQLSNIMKEKLNHSRQNLNWLRKQIKHPGRRLQEQAQRLDDLEIKMRREFHFYLTQNKTAIKELLHGLIQHSPLALIREQQQNNRYLAASLQKATLKSLQNAQFKFADLGRALNNLSPLNILSRGYSMTYDAENNLITQADAVSRGATLRTRLHKGEVVSSVIEINKTASKK